MSDRFDPRVDDYIGALPPWQQLICQEVRELLHAADPDLAETIKRRVQPYFVGHCWPCFGRSSPTTEREDGAASGPRAREPSRHGTRRP